MKDFGLFLCNLRTSAGLSLEELAILIGSSKSTLSRLENNEVPQPFKGGIRKLVLALAEVLCTSHREAERYLDLACIDQSLLTEVEEIQLGFVSVVTPGSAEEVATLEQLERTYRQLLQQLEAREAESGIGNAPPILKLKIQEYTNSLREIQRRLDILSNRVDPLNATVSQVAPVYYAETLGGRIVVGNNYGEELHPVLKSSDLCTLASDNARWLMQLADVERFAIDDCILLTNSNNFRAWEPREIKTTILSSPLPIPDDLAEIQKEKLPAIKQHYFNSPHYRLVSATPAFSELDHLKVVLAPVGFYDYYSLNPFFDEPLLTSLDGSKISIRQKYGNTALTYSSTDRGTSLVPAPISIQCITVTQDKQIILMQRSHSVAFYPNHWSASFEETMNGPTGSKEKPAQKGDENFFAAAMRGLDEEFAIPTQVVRDIKALSLNVEYLTFSIDVITLIELEMTAEEVRQSWMLKARHREEASKFALLSTELSAVVDRLFIRTLWHPTSRMRLIQLLFHLYGIDEVARAIKIKRDALPQ